MNFSAVNVMLTLRILLACFTIAVCANCDLLRRPRQGEKINERAELSNDFFTIRVTAYAEENAGFVGGAYYVFESAPVNSSEWKNIVTVRHDDPIPIPRHQIRFVSNKIGYIFMIWTYAVTTDGGLTWKIWDAFKNLPELRDHPAIDQVEINADGTGRLTFKPTATTLTLRTRDYGEHWAPE